RGEDGLAQRHPRRRRPHPRRDPPRHLGHRRARHRGGRRRARAARADRGGPRRAVRRQPHRADDHRGTGQGVGPVGPADRAPPAARRPGRRPRPARRRRRQRWLQHGLQHGPQHGPPGRAVTLWADLASPDLAAAAARADRGQEVGLVPVGAIEQHGPHLPTGTDAIVAGSLCAAVGERTGSLVLPAIALGVSYGHGTALAGTLSLTPDLLIALVRQYVRWAAVSGLRRLLFVNAHFGNSASLNVATDSVRLLAPR